MKVLCVGRNYERHARELGAPPGEPVWFLKPDSSIIGNGQSIVVPPGIGAVHHEVELALRIGREARRVAADQALRHVDACTVANDVTARDMQAAAKKAGDPWDRSKGYDTFLPLGAWQPAGSADLQGLRLRLTVNGAVRQDGNTRDMTWTCAELLARASQWTTLRPGDVVLTGTPEGVGPIVPGDKVVAEIVGVVRLENPVA
jgi:acylpyruvate hydrolase